MTSSKIHSTPPAVELNSKRTSECQICLAGIGHGSMTFPRHKSIKILKVREELAMSESPVSFRETIAGEENILVMPSIPVLFLLLWILVVLACIALAPFYWRHIRSINVLPG